MAGQRAAAFIRQLSLCPFSKSDYYGVSNGARDDGYFVQILSELSDQQERCGSILEDCSRVFGQQSCRFLSRYRLKSYARGYDAALQHWNSAQGNTVALQH